MTCNHWYEENGEYCRALRCSTTCASGGNGCPWPAIINKEGPELERLLKEIKSREGIARGIGEELPYLWAEGKSTRRAEKFLDNYHNLDWDPNEEDK
jgi:hypothetical protein